MRINYKTHPILNKLTDGRLATLAFHEVDSDVRLFKDGLAAFSDAFRKYAPEIKRDVCVVTEPFYKAMDSARTRLLDLLADISKSDIHDFNACGAAIIGERVFFYKYSFIAGAETVSCFVATFSKKGYPLSFYVNDSSIRVGMVGWVSHLLRLNKSDTKDFLDATLTEVLSLSMFKKFAQVETVLVNNKSRAIVNNEKVLNETLIDITFLDSKWFRNIVRTEGFAVRGHFRLQPKKVEGVWTRELIWINDFQKHGYISKARILNQDTN
jgi:hypothetical protein